MMSKVTGWQAPAGCSQLAGGRCAAAVGWHAWLNAEAMLLSTETYLLLFTLPARYWAGLPKDKISRGPPRAAAGCPLLLLRHTPAAPSPFTVF